MKPLALYVLTTLLLQGRYIPVYASAIYDRNAELQEAGIAPINLTSVIIGERSSPHFGHFEILTRFTIPGNGPQSFIDMLLSLYELQCGYHGYPPFQSIS